ncbi:MAG: cytochrome B, partial [Alphaproteobacteria bacterium]|nr:cytochrome B [Alphaproteobacteria bacterium]
MLPVWDLAVRCFHWSLVGAVTVAGVTGFILGPTWLTYHLWAGALMTALVFARTIWGVLGPTYARFSSFIAGPFKIMEHGSEVLSGKAKRHLGHNPLGGAMIIGLMLSIFALAITGTFQLGGEFKVGPFSFLTTYFYGDTFGGLHKLIAWGLLALISLHILGAVFESMRTRENLPLTMITGKKERRRGDHILPQIGAKPALALLLVMGGWLGVGLLGLSMSSKPGIGMPINIAGSQYGSECADCHIAYHPSLMQGENWALLMANLDNHFGEDASLGSRTKRQLTDWLIANSSAAADTKAANVLNDRRITATNPVNIPLA